MKKETKENLVTAIVGWSVIIIVIILLVSPSTILRYVGLDNHKPKSKINNEKNVYICNKTKSKTNNEQNTYICYKTKSKKNYDDLSFLYVIFIGSILISILLIFGGL